MKKIKCIWIGGSGVVPQIGKVVQGEQVEILENFYNEYKNKKLVTDIKKQVKSTTK